MRAQRERGTWPGERRGFALIAALWLLVAFATVGAAISIHARARRLGAANALDEDRGRSAAEAGLEHARSRLARLIVGTTPSPQVIPTPVMDPWRDATLLLADTSALGDERYHVTIRDAGASLNINRATEEELQRFFTALPIDAGRATEIAESIMDWRDTDDLHRLHGAEVDEYLRMGSPVLPANDNFSRVEELQYVKGMTPEIFARARPFLTLMGTGQINVNSAPRPVLLALPGMTDEAVAVLERMRGSSQTIQSVEELTRLLSSGAREGMVGSMAKLMPIDMMPLIAFETRELDVRSEGWTDGSPVHKWIEALVVRAGGFGVVAFRQAS
jgi:general secretion pathway protein K